MPGGRSSGRYLARVRPGQDQEPRHHHPPEALDRELRPPPEADDQGLVLSGVSKAWVDRRRTALRDVDLAIGRGSTAAIVGANGSGKTTMLRVITGTIRPDSGTVSLNGLDSERDGREYRSRIGYLAAGNSGLFARLSVRRHLDYSAHIALLTKREAQRCVDRVLDAFALRELASRRVDRLSLGQRQRVRTALAFLHSPELVLLDEPHNSLDDHGMLLLDRAVGELTARGGIALWCAPAVNNHDGRFDRTFVMRAGNLAPA